MSKPRFIAGDAASQGKPLVAADLRRIANRILGVPDYEAYIAHSRAEHPRTVPLSRSEFMRQRLDARYSRPGARCC
ncbi:hypothetical protein BH23GEM2_BH23GEM2_19340 [soil metagenome]